LKSTCALNHSKNFIKVSKMEKARKILLYQRKTLKVNDYGTLSSVETTSHSRNSIRTRLQKVRYGRGNIVCECAAIISIRVRLYGNHSSYLKRLWRSHFEK